MLKLKKLQILGFKSFCDRTELQFTGEGIAAIVGPNGCGKSNVSDAISWVLGEQSAKTLRGTQMQDVIFAGTRERKPTGMAEVSLTLIDPGVFDGSVGAEPEIDIRDGFEGDDWDEAGERASRSVQTAAAVEEAQPGVHLTEEDATAEEREAAEIAREAAGEEQGGVVLKIRRRKFQSKQFRAGEIVVTRRLFRTGDSEYLLNGKLCRLRDIQDIFMGTGLGPESYAIIEQGRIGQILSSKPHDRRAILEEAAGVTRFKTRKRLAELRLEQAKGNLARVNDIFEEVTRQMRSLQRQAAKAERFANLREEMRAKLRVVLASKFAQVAEEAAGAEEGLARTQEVLVALGSELHAMQESHGAATGRGYELDSELKARAEELSGLAIEIDRSRARMRSNEERDAELEARIVSAAAELEGTGAQAESLKGERETNASILRSAAEEVTQAQAEAVRKQQEAMEVNRGVVDSERRIEEHRGMVMETMGQISRMQTQIAQAEEQVAAFERDRERTAGEMVAALGEIEGAGGRRGQLTMEFESVSERVVGLGEKIAGVRIALESKRGEETSAKKALDALRAEYATYLGKRNSLDAVIREHGYSTESVKRLLKSGALHGGMTPAGVLADFLEVDEQYESVVDEFLRDELSYIVVKSWDAAEEGMRVLRTDVDGRATFLVHPNDSQARFPFTVDDGRATPQPDRIVPLTRAIQVLDGFGRSLEVVLPKLRDGYIAQSAEVARELALDNPDAYFLSPSGEMFHNVTVTGGKKAGEGPLALKRELREVARRCREIEQSLQSEEGRALLLGREIAELSSLLESLHEEKRDAERLAMTSGHALRQMEGEIARVEQRLATQRVELERIAKAREAKVQWIAERRRDWELLERKREQSQAQVSSILAGVAELKAAREVAAQAAAEWSARVAALEERRRSAAASLSRLEGLLADVCNRVRGLEAQIAGARGERQQRLAENEELAIKLGALGEQRSHAQERAGVLTNEAGQLRALLGEMDVLMKTARAELDTVRDRRGELAAIAAKTQAESAHLHQSCMQELGVAVEELAGAEGMTRISGAQLAEQETEHQALRAKLEAMGPVNMMALDEYKEIAQRHDFLQAQRGDLLDSIENTQNTIREIDLVSRDKFEEAFTKINENFQASFRTLFGGGQGFLKLTDPENVSESGIDIIASPPGKKLQNVLLLSGGEKALTALALLIAVFQHTPSPFCILDEVDAPLDEVNVGRLTDLLREMSAQTQFIVITHHKKTMSISPVMYGVTMQEPGVSKIVSVRFGEGAQERRTAVA